MLTYFVFIFFLSIVIYGFVRKKWMAGIFIVMVYALSAFASIFLLQADTTFKAPTIIPTILYCGLLFVTLKPFIRNRPVIEGFRTASEQKRFVLVGYALSLVVILGMIIILPKITNALDYGLVDSRTAMYRGEGEDSSHDSILMKIGSQLVGYFGAVWYLYIIMFFYAVAFIHGKSLLKILLMVASLSQVEVGLTVGGRTNAIYWLLSFLFTLILFYPYLTRKTRKIAISSFLVFFVVVLVYVVFITIQRSIFREGGTQLFLLQYVGEPYLYFCYFIEKLDWHSYSFERIFPFGSYLLGTGFNLQDYRYLVEQHTGMEIGIFYTFMGDIYVDLGLLGLLVFVFIYNRIASTILRPKVFYLKNLFYLGVLYTVPLHGLFYYSLWKNGDFCVIFVLVLARYVSGVMRTNKSTSTTKEVIKNEKI